MAGHLPRKTAGRAEQSPAERTGLTVRTAGWTAGAGSVELESPVRTPGQANAARQTTRAADRGHYSRREDFTGRGPRNYRRPDERILEDVSDRLTDDAMVDASEIAVEVKQGEVSLTGTVKDRDQKRRAEDLAERVSGVKDVINALRIVAGVKSGP